MVLFFASVTDGLQALLRRNKNLPGGNKWSDGESRGIEQDARTKNWFLRWRERGDDEKIHKRSLKCESYSDAVSQRDRKRDDLKAARNSTHNPRALLLPLFETYMREMERVRHLRPGALKCKREGVAHLIADAKTLGDITRDQLRDLRDDMLDTDLSPVSVGIRLREVKAFVRWLHFEGHLTLNPWVSIELPTYEPKPRFLTNDELATLEQVCPRRFLPLVRMAYLTGMRKNEILKANWEDISWIKGRAFLTVEATTAKNRRSRTIPLRAEVVKLLGSRGKGRIFAEWDVHKIRWAWECVKKAAKFVGRVRFP
jgi:integrase